MKSIWKILILLALVTFSYSQDVVLGDLNNDQAVNVIDIVDLVDIIFGTEPDEYQMQSGDLNFDGELNIQDVVLIVEIILEILCPEFEYQCNPSSLNCCTSHDVVFSVHTFGTFGSDIFDSWIFNENYIISVGYLSVAGQGHFSGAIWDGEDWEIFQFLHNHSVANPFGMWSFSDTNVYLATGSIYHWDGNPDYELNRVWTIDFENYPNESARHVWAASDESIYFVGRGGGIIHYNGETFNRMESGTDVWLKDVWGYVDPETGEETVWACGWDYDLATVLLIYDGDTWDPVYDADEYAWELLPDHLSNIVLSVWSTDSFLYVLTGNGLYQCSHETTGEGTLILENEWFVDSRWQVRGLSDNDIFIAGYNQEIMHYNGETWAQINYSPGDYLDNLHVTDHVLIAGGYRAEEVPIVRALLLHGVRNQP